MINSVREKRISNLTSTQSLNSGKRSPVEAKAVANKKERQIQRTLLGNGNDNLDMINAKADHV